MGLKAEELVSLLEKNDVNCINLDSGVIIKLDGNPTIVYPSDMKLSGKVNIIFISDKKMSYVWNIYSEMSALYHFCQLF